VVSLSGSAGTCFHVVYTPHLALKGLTTFVQLNWVHRERNICFNEISKMSSFVLLFLTPRYKVANNIFVFIKLFDFQFIAEGDHSFFIFCILSKKDTFFLILKSLEKIIVLGQRATRLNDKGFCFYRMHLHWVNHAPWFRHYYSFLAN